LPVAAAFFVLFSNVLTSWAALTDQDFASTVIKIYGVFSAINGVVFCLSPKHGCEAWNFASPSSSTLTVMRMNGTVLLTHAVAVLFQSFYDDKSAMEMLAYATGILGVSSLLVLKDFMDAKNDKGTQLYAILIAISLATSYICYT
jgi:uncharacterized membrane protein HdeD (DUF308 family)